MMVFKTRQKQTNIILLSSLILSGFFLAPIASHADAALSQSQGQSDSNGTDIPIKVGEPIIIKDKKPAPPPPQK